LHDNTTRLAAKLIASGTMEGAAVNIIRSALNVSQAPHDDRWQERYDDIPHLVESAVRKYRHTPTPPVAATKARELKAMAFNPVRFLVLNLIPNEGVTLVCAKPKSGKSWLVQGYPHRHRRQGARHRRGVAPEMDAGLVRKRECGAQRTAAIPAPRSTTFACGRLDPQQGG
jgi:hypothetical protein